MKTRASLWLQAMQAPALVVVLIPVAFGSSFALWDRTFDGGLFLLTLLAVLLVQTGSALIAAVSDHLYSTHTGHPFLAHPMLKSGIFSIREFRMMAAALLGLACICGIILALESGPLVWWLGVLGGIAVFLYRGKERIVSFRGSTEVITFLTLGPLVAVGSYYVQAGFIRYQALICAIPIGLLASIIESVTHMRDLGFDRKASHHSLVKWLGRRRAAFLIRAELFLVYLSGLVLVLVHWLPLETLLSWLSIPQAFKLATSLKTQRTAKLLHMRVGDAILLYVTYGLLLVIGYDLHILLWRP